MFKVILYVFGMFILMYVLHNMCFYVSIFICIYIHTVYLYIYICKPSYMNVSDYMHVLHVYGCII